MSNGHAGRLTPSQPILIVEDSDDDYEATVRALTRDGPLSNPILRCEDGAEALQYLEAAVSGDTESPTLPGIVLLDLNLPGVDGREVLKRFKSTEATCRIPIVILTTSDDEWDVNRCYEAGANTYIKKPVDLDGFFTALRSLKEYWLQVAVLPRETEQRG